MQILLGLFQQVAETRFMQARVMNHGQLLRLKAS